MVGTPTHQQLCMVSCESNDKVPVKFICHGIASDETTRQLARVEQPPERRGYLDPVPGRTPGAYDRLPCGADGARFV